MPDGYIKDRADVADGSDRAILTAGQSLPVYPDQGTFSEYVGMSQRCHKRKWPPKARSRSLAGAERVDVFRPSSSYVIAERSATNKEEDGECAPIPYLLYGPFWPALVFH
jgi:hypothetical protein